jgi:vacuolar protein sorting-associated protein 13A/C
MRLGHIDAKNSFDSAVTKTSASLHGIKLVSSLQTRNGSSQLKIIDDINVDAEVTQTTGIDRNVDLAHPDMQVRPRQRKRALEQKLTNE